VPRFNRFIELRRGGCEISTAKGAVSFPVEVKGQFGRRYNRQQSGLGLNTTRGIGHGRRGGHLDALEIRLCAQLQRQLLFIRGGQNACRRKYEKPQPHTSIVASALPIPADGESAHVLILTEHAPELF
jgi:hypothetical protein